MSDERWYEHDFELDSTTKKAAEEAIKAQEQGAKSYDIKVGAAVEMYDGSIYPGFNMENMRHEGEHAERLAIKNALSDGYNTTDFKSLVIIFGQEEHESITVPCLGCQAVAWDYTHPKLEIVEVGTDGKPLYRTRLDELVDPPGEGVSAFPSVDMMGYLSNREPKLPLADELVEAYHKDEQFQAFCDQLGISP